MISTKQINQELRDIRYYYSKQKELDRPTQFIGKTAISKLVEKYNDIIKDAPVKLYDVYIQLYVNNNTQVALAYLMKYIEKSGEKIVYSKGLSQFFISDVMDEDIAWYIGVDDRKLLLFDDFKCFDEGTCMGTVSKETIENMRKAN